MLRGEVYRINLKGKTGHQQQGPRYGVILQNDNLLVLSTVIIAPTSTSTDEASFRPVITIDGTETMVLVEQATAVNWNEIGDRVGNVTRAELEHINQALTLVLGLN